VKKIPKKITSRLAAAVMEERQRISRELHDRVLQLLASVRLRAETCRRELLDNRSALETELQTMEDSIDKAIIEIRNLLSENQSAEDLQAGTLERRLKQELEIFCARTGFKLDFRCAIGPHNLPIVIERELYFTLREAILNTVRHSRATELHLWLKTTDRGCEARLRDNGVGFDTASVGGTGHYGLAGMRERIRKIGGTLTLDTAAGKGTDIKIRIPLASH
jgi:NarL family two-component system sensor histidine kinase LiaS